jgi:GntR family transcriptional regulator/MocR family aminotransferase
MDLIINLDGNSTSPLYHQLYEQLRETILTGKLLPHQKLPSTRSLAKSLKISRTTVTQCYEQLIAEGYLQTQVGSGTFVSSDLSTPTTTLFSDDIWRSPSEFVDRHTNDLGIKLSTYGDRVSRSCSPTITTSDAPISFRYGSPALDFFPVKIWRKLFLRHCGSNLTLLDYSPDIFGHLALREALCNYLKIVRGVRCQPEQIVITNGSQQALDLITRVLIEPGEAIAIEDPGYIAARRVFQMQGAKLFPVPVDESGLIISKLFALPKPKLIYVTPSHQFPTGAVLSLSRRLELLTWAQGNNTVVIEDDYDSEFRYDSRPIPALQGLDRQDSVIYIGTVSKILFPSLRIGYLILPPSLVKVFATVRWLIDRHTPAIEQQMLADFINEGYLERHIRRLRNLYDRRRQALVMALKRYLGERVQIFGANAGIHLMVKIETSLSDRAIIEAAARLGVGLFTTENYYLQGISKGEFLLGYSEPNEIQIEEGIKILAQIIDTKN